MRLLNFRLLLSTMIVIAGFLEANGDVPTETNIQGRLTDSTGAPVGPDAMVFEFSIWDNQSSGSQIWPSSSTEAQIIDIDAAGLWNAMVGAVIPLTPDVFSDSSRWLEIIVSAAGVPTTLPRVKLNTGPFAFRAAWSQRADTADAVSGLVAGPYLPLSGGTMTGDIANTGNPSITMGKGNFGNNNFNSGYMAFVAGNGNSAVGDRSTIPGGESNVAIGALSTIGGGAGSRTDGQYATIGGGAYNLAVGDFSVIAGGGGALLTDSNSTSGSHSAIGGGRGNAATGEASVIAGGVSNFTSGTASTIGGGDNNAASHNWSTVAGGYYDTASGEQSTIGGGAVNVATSEGTTIAGGQSNRATAIGATIGGGSGNRASGLASTIGGGDDNQASNQDATIGGGKNNIANGSGSTISGGAWNRTWGQFAVVAGGGGNAVEDSNSAVGDASVIGGGRRNVASALGTTVSGGQSNTASANFATVPGGVFNTASGRFAFAAGRHAAATQIGSFVWADSLTDVITSPGINTFSIRASGGIWLGTNSAPSIDGTDFLNTSTGAHLTTGGVWTNSSDANKKENVAAVDGAAILELLARLPIHQWNYRSESAQVRHVGPTAQDFYGLFGLGTDDRSISTIDPAGIALAAIQELDRRTQRIEALEAEVAELRTLVQDLVAAQE